MTIFFVPLHEIKAKDIMRKSVTLLFFIGITGLALLSTSCRNKLEDRAQQEAQEYTMKYCPTPVYNYSRTDSLTFDPKSHTFTYHCTLTDVMDNSDIIAKNKENLSQGLLKAIISSTQLKTYKDANYNFRYLIHSASQPKNILFDKTYTSKDYQTE